jgi:hypothetical protein
MISADASWMLLVLQTGKVVAIKKIDVGGSKEASACLMLQDVSLPCQQQ